MMKTSKNANIRAVFDEDPLKILIVGAGIEGLFAAIALRQSGHIVELYEVSQHHFAAAINIPPNINSLLRRLGLIPEHVWANQVEWISEYGRDCNLIWRENVSSLQRSFIHPWQICHQADIYAKMRELAVSDKERGTPVKINSQNSVISIDGEAAALTLDTGETMAGNLCVVLNEIKSIVCNITTSPKSHRDFHDLVEVYMLLPVSKVIENPNTRRFFERTGEISIYCHDDKIMMLFPCRNNTELSVILTHTGSKDRVDARSRAEGNNNRGPKSSILNFLKGFHADIIELIGMVKPDSICYGKILDYKLNIREGAYFTTLGHESIASLRFHGQVAGGSIEDSAALAALIPLGTKISDLESRLVMHKSCRTERLAKIQRMSQNGDFSYKVSSFTNCDFDNDAYNHAEGILLRELARRAKFSRMPLGYGITPGPRQDSRGNPYSMSDATIRTAYMTFMAPKSYISTMMPTEDYTLNKDGAWTAVTFSNTEIGNISWLGNRSYIMFGFFIHDVSYTTPHLPNDKNRASLYDSNAQQKGGEVVGDHKYIEGTYLSVLFENLPDPIISGREELGFAKLYATLTATANLRTYNLAAGWEGQNFCTLSLSELFPVTTASVRNPPGPLLHCKTIPATGSTAGSLDVLYATVSPIPRPEEFTQDKAWQVASSGGARLEFTCLEGLELEKAFPTLCHVIRRLKGIEIGEIVEARVVEGVGLGNLEGQLRW